MIKLSSVVPQLRLAALASAATAMLFTAQGAAARSRTASLSRCIKTTQIRLRNWENHETPQRFYRPIFRNICPFAVYAVFCFASGPARILEGNSCNKGGSMDIGGIAPNRATYYQGYVLFYAGPALPLHVAACREPTGDDLFLAELIVPTFVPGTDGRLTRCVRRPVN